MFKSISSSRLIIATLIFMGVALLVSCKKEVVEIKIDLETLKTQQVDNLTLIYSVNGKLSYRFETPLVESYELASQPYREFRKGVKVESYNDSTHVVESTLIADYAKLIDPLQLWEARGNVIVTNNKGQVIETQQLFWDQKTDKIYSGVDTKITQHEDVVIGIGCETNSKFDNFKFYRPRGKVTVNTEPNSEEADNKSVK